MSTRHKLRYSLLPGLFAICKLPAHAPVPGWISSARAFCSVTRTQDELSIVCSEDSLPSGVSASVGWVCMQLAGPFAFSETGILSSFLEPLARHNIGIFALSTFDTDYVLIQQKFWTEASRVLREAGHEEIPASVRKG